MSGEHGKPIGEPLIDAIDAAEVLDRAGTPLSEAVRSALSPGAVKDALSGTWLGHPLQPGPHDLLTRGGNPTDKHPGLHTCRSSVEWQ